ncbi:MAG: DNA double-strand break repair nuclease NurA [Candidatus Nanoarchaeia archaeon]|nr:DNA double-strand break repair nuclease NurA [Candidatus Nanoarchaeia archaeon]
MIINELKKILGQDDFMPFSEDFCGVKIESKNFSIIDGKMPCKVVCIDGGCSVLADGGSWSISKIKVGIVEYDGLKKIIQESKENYLIIVQKKGYEIVSISKAGVLKLNLSGIDSLKIEELPSKIMKYFEWVECIERNEECLFLMDSPLNAETAFEKEVIKKALEKKKNVVGFCKTSRARTVNGRSLLGVINFLGPKNSEWVYHPIFENEGDVKTFVSKLDSATNFCYKVEVPQYSDFKSVFKFLSFFSKDSEILGYPYPLFVADKVARVNSFEKKRELFNIENELKKNGLFFDALSGSFHSHLDSKMYRKA